MAVTESRERSSNQFDRVKQYKLEILGLQNLRTKCEKNPGTRFSVRRLTEKGVSRIGDSGKTRVDQC